VLDVERCFLRGCVLLGKDQLIAGTAARDFQPDGQIATAKNLSLMEEVDQVGQEFPARDALEAARMPGYLLSCTICLNGNFAHGDRLVAVGTQNSASGVCNK